MHEIYERGIADIRSLLNAKKGVVFSEQTASRALFAINKAIIHNIPGNNVVTTAIEHPSNYDAVVRSARDVGKEVRVASANPVNGGVEVDEIIKKIDNNTTVLSIICASNMTGAILDIKQIVKKARSIKKDLYVVVDITQHIPHGVIDLDEWNVDGVAFAPYKIFGKRGVGIGYLSDRASVLPHEKLIEKPSTYWDLGSIEPHAMGCMSQVVDYLVWLGSNFTDKKERRELIEQGMRYIHKRESSLLLRMLEGGSVAGIRPIEGAKANFIPSSIGDRDCIVALSFNNINAQYASKYINDNGVVVFERLESDIMSKRILTSLKAGNIIRVSPCHYNTFEEIDEFLKIISCLSKQH